MRPWRTRTPDAAGGGWHCGSRLGRGRIAEAAAYGAMILLAGRPAVALLGWALWGVILLAGGSGWQGLARAAAAPLLAAALAAPLLLPGLEVLAGSWRSEAGTSAAAVEADSFAPRRWPELLLPRLYGRPSPALPGGFWAASSFPWQRYLLDLHLGSIPLLLLLLSRRRKEARPWLLAAGVLVLLAAFPPLLLVLRRWLPFLRLLRFAIKCLIPAAVVLAPAVALGARTALERPGSFRKGALVLALPLLLLLVPALWPGLLRTLLGGIFPASAANLALPGVCRAVARDLRLDLVVALFPLAAAAWSPRPRAPRGGPGRFPTLASQHRGRYPPPDPAGQRVSARCPYAARPSPDPGLREQRPVPAGVGPLPSRAPDHGSAGGGSSHSGPSDSQRCGGAHTPGQPTGAVTVSRAARHQ